MNARELLDRAIEGDVVARGDAGYEAARRASVWNALKPDRYPELIARAASTDDVVEVVRFARSHGLKLAVRCGGHNWVGAPVRDGGVLLDLSGLRELSIDTSTMSASIQPGVIGSDLARALGERGLAFPTGHCPTVPLSGYVLSGGLGWNPGVWGPAAFSVRSLELVTAEGELVVASEDENSDLFWAARGGGPGFFAVVTRFHVQVYPLPRAITTAFYAFPLADLAEIVDWVASIVPTLAPEVELSLLLTTAPATGEKSVVISAIAFADSADEAASALVPLEQCPALERALSRQANLPTTFEALYEVMGAAFPEEHRYAADTLWSAAPPGEVIPRLGEKFADVPSSRSLILALIAPPQPPGASPPPDAAFSMMTSFYVVAYAIWDEAADDAANVAWLRETVGAIEPHGMGHYVGEADLTVPGRMERSYAAPNWERLQQIRAQRDPDGLFHEPLG